MEDLASFAEKGMREVDYLLRRRIPAFRRMMKRAGVSPNISPLLALHLTERGVISSSVSGSPLPELTPSAPSTPLPHSLSCRLSPSLATPNSVTNLPVVAPLPIPIPLEDIDASGATPSVIGRLTMTELVAEFMEDLLTQEFSPIQLDEDI